MFKQILIANRGEIACRIIMTAQRMGVKTVAVYSDPDADALHVQQADEAIKIGGTALSDSYLNSDKIIAAALSSGAQAIHPGYGFLSENADFVEAVVAAGLTFIGPSASSIRAMGLKDAAKTLMQEAGVPVVPGYHGTEQSASYLAEQAELIGYPVLIKARAGGGGKGMRRVDSPDEFAQALESASREGLASFGDAAVLIEKYIETPRHIEIQIFADNFGNVVHLFERDCSLQRRHQKVIEEAPAPEMTDELRDAMTRAAIKAAQAINYSGAGTIEFIVDGSGPLSVDGFWFMEMNTRLQVEHPVTEAITLTDLVEAQLLVSSGQELPFTQDMLAITGHSIEARLYAEDVASDFLPVSGTLNHLAFGDGVRVDTGVESGNTITPFFDPMIAKLIAWGPTRESAQSKLETALRETHIAGTVTNVAFLSALLRHEDFSSGKVDTGFIERNFESLAFVPEPDFETQLIAAIVLYKIDPLGTYAGWRAYGQASHLVKFNGGDTKYRYRLGMQGNKSVQLQSTATIDKSAADKVSCVNPMFNPGDILCQIQITAISDSSVSYLLGSSKKQASIYHWAEPLSRKVSVCVGGYAHTFERPDPNEQASDTSMSGDVLLAPMTGVVMQIQVQPGQLVSAGSPVIVMEAMKMESVLCAPRDGVIDSIHCAEGQSVDGGAIILRLREDNTA